MSRKELFVVVLAHVFACYLALGLLALASTAVYVFGAEAEIYFSPVIRFAPTDAITRDAGRACFTLHISKVHAALPLKYSFFVEAKLSERIPVAASIVDERTGRKGPQELRPHAVGTSWPRRYCFDMPSTISDDQEIRVTGQAQHRRHPFWTTVTPVPPFVVAALGSR